MRDGLLMRDFRAGRDIRRKATAAKNRAMLISNVLYGCTIERIRGEI